jgi:hypothetical protein
MLQCGLQCNKGPKAYYHHTPPHYLTFLHSLLNVTCRKPSPGRDQRWPRDNKEQCCKCSETRVRVSMTKLWTTQQHGGTLMQVPGCFKTGLDQAFRLPSLWSNDHNSWLQIQRSWVRFPVLPNFMRSTESGTGSTQPREDNWGASWTKRSGSGLEKRDWLP